MAFKKWSILLMVLFLTSSMTGLAQSTIPTGLADSSPNQAVLVNYDDWYAANAKPNDPKIVGKTIFTSPRSVVMIRDAGKGTLASSHFHSTADEIVIVLGGSAEILINGTWTSVKNGDVHVNPRGIIHATRVIGNEDFRFISVFTPSLPTSGDANFIKAGEAANIPLGLVDSTPNTAVLVNYDEWYAANAKPNEPKIIGKTIFSSPRSVVMIRDAGKGTLAKSHFHSTADEIVVVLGGSAEILINGTWTSVKPGDVHVNPRGIVHATRVMGNEDFRFISIFTPSLPVGGDANYIQ